MIIQIEGEYVDARDITKISKLFSHTKDLAVEFFVWFGRGISSTHVRTSADKLLEEFYKGTAFATAKRTQTERIAMFRAAEALMKQLRDDIACVWDSQEARAEIPDLSAEAYMNKYRQGIEKMLRGDADKMDGRAAQFI